MAKDPICGWRESYGYEQTMVLADPHLVGKPLVKEGLLEALKANEDLRKCLACNGYNLECQYYLPPKDKISEADKLRKSQVA